MSHPPLEASWPEAEGRSGVTICDEAACAPGYTLWWTTRGHEAALIDLHGNTLHRWRQPDDAIGWHNLELLADGHLLVVQDDRRRRNLVELDWTGEVVRRFDIPAHHDARRLRDGNTLALATGRAHYTHIWPEPRSYDYFLEVDHDGRIVWEWHAAEHAGSIFEQLEMEGAGTFRNWPHLNTVELLPDGPTARADERFREGNLLTCARHVHTVLVIDRETLEMAWAWGPGELQGPHHPQMLPNGNLLIFDNGWGPPSRGWSRVIELDVTRERIVWSYGEREDQRFFTTVGSGAQRLANGNTLICAANFSKVGRLFEVTPEGRTVWEFWHPEGRHFYRCRRYAAAAIDPLLDGVGA